MIFFKRLSEIERAMIWVFGWRNLQLLYLVLLRNISYVFNSTLNLSNTF